MGRKNQINAGIANRTVKCPDCEKQYRGNPRMVDKLITMHMKKEHNIKKNEIQITRASIPVDGRSNNNNPQLASGKENYKKVLFCKEPDSLF